MRKSAIVLLLACSAVVAQPSDDAVKKELKLFQGKWQAAYARDFNGNKQTDVENQLTSLDVDGDKFTLKTGSLTIKGTIVLDPTKKVKTIDIFFGDSTDKPMRGIYEIKEDTRRSCFAMPGKDRPTEFRMEKGYLTLEWRLDK